MALTFNDGSSINGSFISYDGPTNTITVVSSNASLAGTYNLRLTLTLSGFSAYSDFTLLVGA